MESLPKEPVFGQALSVTWARQLLRYIRQIRPLAGKGMALDITTNGTVLNCKAIAAEVIKQQEAARLKPFAVRWYSHFSKQDAEKGEVDLGQKGEWQIYLPKYTVTMNGEDYDISNDKAKDEEGREIADWYKIEEPEEADGTSYDVDRGEDVPPIIGLKWDVYVYVKTWPQLKASFKSKRNEEEVWQKNFRDLLVGEIAEYEVEVEIDGANQKQSIHETLVQLREEPVEYERDDRTPFSIKYTRNEQSPLGWGPVVTNCMTNIGRNSLTCGDVGVSDASEVYVKISHPEASFTMSVITSGEQTNDDQTVVQIYQLDKASGEIIIDGRDLINKIPLYSL